VHRLSYGEDLRRLIVGHVHAVGVLELLHQRVQIERVRLEILSEAGVLSDRARLDLELVCQMSLDQREHLLSGARAHRPAPGGAGSIRAAENTSRHPALVAEVEALIPRAAG